MCRFDIRFFLKLFSFLLCGIFSIALVGTTAAQQRGSRTKSLKLIEVPSTAVFQSVARRGVEGKALCVDLRGKGIPAIRAQGKFFTLASYLASVRANAIPQIRKMHPARRRALLTRLENTLRNSLPICKERPLPTPSPSPSPSLSPTPHFTISPTPRPTLPPIEAKNVSLQVSENVGGSVRLGASRSNDVRFRIVTQPTSGSLSDLVTDTVYYTPKRFFSGADSFTFEVSDSSGQSRGTVSIQVIAGQASFSGKVDSLAPYREELSTEETNQLKKRFFGLESLRGRTRIADVLSVLEAAGNDAPALESEALAEAQKDLWQMRDTIEGVACWYPQNTLWHHQALVNYWLVHMVKGNPFKERQSSLLTNLFAVNFNAVIGSDWGRHQYQPQYLSLIRSHALKNFDLLASRMHADGAMLVWLDNRFNTSSDLNENYSREFLELFSVGTVDPITLSPNYTEEDARVGAARALAGFTERFDKRTEQFNCADNKTRPRDVWVGQPSFHLDRWMNNPSQPENIRLFAGTPWEGNLPFIAHHTVDNFTPHVMYNHPGAARNIGSRLFTQFVHPKSSEAVVSGLGAQLTSTGYDMKEALKTLIRSEAMYSPETRMSCVSSPMESFISLMRTLKLPLVRNSTHDMFSRLRNAMAESGMTPLAPPSVFGVTECGVNRDGKVRDGSVFLTTQHLLQRKRHVVFILNTAERLGYDWSSLLPAGAEGNNPQLVVNHILDTMGVTMGNGGKDLLVQYLTTARYSVGAAPVDRGIAWNRSNADLVKLKVPGLIQLIFESMEGQLR